MRAFTTDGKSITFVDQKPTQGCYAVKFLDLPNNMVFMGLSNGKFMIWDLGSNQTQEDDGHGQGRSITEVIKFE